LRARRKSLRVVQSAIASTLDVSQSRLSVMEQFAGPVMLERLLAWVNVLGLELVVREKQASAPGVTAKPSRKPGRKPPNRSTAVASEW
jgi:transcriptional regulator with XRE-family HTH domain